jgi:hypothetical protein
MTCHLLQSAVHENRFLHIETRSNVKETRSVMAPWPHVPHEFPSSFEAVDYATKHLAPDSWVLRTQVDGKLLPLPKKIGVHA